MVIDFQAISLVQSTTDSKLSGDIHGFDLEWKTTVSKTKQVFLRTRSELKKSFTTPSKRTLPTPLSADGAMQELSSFFQISFIGGILSIYLCIDNS